MPIISQKKRDRISEQILAFLFSSAPSAEFTNRVAEEVVRDEEFTKALLLELEGKKLVVRVDKSSSGVPYSRRLRWRLSNSAFEAYKKHQ